MGESNLQLAGFRPLPGMKDLGSTGYGVLKGAEKLLQNLLASYGYQIIDTPVLEPADLYLGRSGGELSSKLYSFTDRDGERLSLRPEFTASVIRYFLSQQNTPPLPVRWQYSGPVFRHEGVSGASYRQFHQLGAELIGSADVRADGEVLSLAWGILNRLSISQCKFVVSHVGVVNALLRALQMSDSMRLYLLESLPELSKGHTSLNQVKERARERGLLQDSAGKGQWQSIIHSLGEEGARSLIEELIYGLGEGAAGSRSSSEVVNRFLQRIKGTDDPQQVEKAFQLVSSLAEIRGEPTVARKGIEALAKEFRLDASIFKPLADILALIEVNDHGKIPILIDIALTRGIGYYSGLIFEIYHGDSGNTVSIGGGGRYDGLVHSLGGAQEVPAIGFAFNLEHLLETVAIQDFKAEKPLSDRVLLVPDTQEAHGQALLLAGRLRAGGLVVEMEVYARHPEASIQYAKAKGIQRVIRVERGGKVVETNLGEQVKG